MHSNSRLLNIILVVALQLVVLLASVANLFTWLQHKTTVASQRHVIESNEAFAEQVVGRIQEMSLSNIQSDTVDQQRLQLYVERVQLPHDGFVALIDDRTGKILCHPQMRQNPNLKEKTWDDFCKVQGGSRKSKNGESSVVKKLQDNTTTLQAAGVMELADSVYYVNAHRIPELGAIVLTTQSCTKNWAQDKLVVDSMSRFVFSMALITGLLGLGISFICVQRFQNATHQHQIKLENEVETRKNELLKTQNAVIFGLAKLAESRDNDTGEHLDRIRKYVTILAEDLACQYPEIDDSFIQNLGLASSLHDIGKVGIPDCILLKPGRLNQQERAMMELHTLLGGECLEAIGDRLGTDDFLVMAREVAFWHHERWDGSGYPHGLSGTAIPIAARIVSVADVYDALTSRRPYKEPMSHTESRAIILGGSGTQFDPEIVDAFLRHEDEFQRIAATYNATVEKPLAMKLSERISVIA